VSSDAGNPRVNPGPRQLGFPPIAAAVGAKSLPFGRGRYSQETQHPTTTGDDRLEEAGSIADVGRPAGLRAHP
jgi:hypothetical protein